MELHLLNNTQVLIFDLIIPVGDKHILICCQAKAYILIFSSIVLPMMWNKGKLKV